MEVLECHVPRLELRNQVSTLVGRMTVLESSCLVFRRFFFVVFATSFWSDKCTKVGSSICTLSWPKGVVVRRSTAFSDNRQYEHSGGTTAVSCQYSSALKRGPSH